MTDRRWGRKYRFYSILGTDTDTRRIQGSNTCAQAVNKCYAVYPQVGKKSREAIVGLLGQYMYVHVNTYVDDI